MKKLTLSMLAVGCSAGLFTGAASAESVSSNPANTLTISQSGTTAVTQSGVTLSLQGLTFGVYDYRTGEVVSTKGDSPFRYYASADGKTKFLCQGNPEFGGTVIGRYYTTAGITKVLEGSRYGVNNVKVWVDPRTEAYTNAESLPGYTFVTDYLEGY